MTPEAQRIAIAEACDKNDPHWFCDRCNERVEGSHVSFTEHHDVERCGSRVRFMEVPNYICDLNAMHEAEKTLTHVQIQDFAEWLGYCGDEFPIKNVKRLLHATAAQRAEAFLRTIGKWDDSK